MMDAKTERAKRNDFSLHVALIMKSDGTNKGTAQFRAWLEGEAGLKTRLAATNTLAPTLTK